jgi:hypothetical protein
LGTGIDVSTIKKVKNSLHIEPDLIELAYGKAKAADCSHDKTEATLKLFFLKQSVPPLF